MLGDDSGVYGSGGQQIYLHTLGSMANKKIYIVWNMCLMEMIFTHDRSGTRTSNPGNVQQTC